MGKGKVTTLDIGASKIRVQIVDVNGKASRGFLIGPVGLGLNNAKFTQFLIESAKSVVENQRKKSYEKIVAISIGAPGSVNSVAGVIKYMPNIKNVENLDVVQKLKQTFNLPVFLLNDADAGTLGEWRFGAGRGFRKIIYITLGSGVGSGVIVNGKIKSGSELGHILLAVNKEKRLCGCGKTNCAESFLGVKGLAEIYAKIFNAKISGLDNDKMYSLSPEMREGVRVKDKKWLTVQDIYTDYLTVFLKNITSSYQTKIIILGGGIAFGNEPLLKSVLKKTEGQFKIVLAKFENSVNLGLAYYAFTKLGR